MKDKKGNLKGIVLMAVTTVLSIALIFGIFAGTNNEITRSAYEISEANNCSDGGLTYDFSSGNCTGTGVNYVAGRDTLPLQALFSPSGVVLLVFVAGILISAVAISLKMKKR